MATFKIAVLKHQKRRDNKYPISIRVTSARQSSYIATGYYASDSQLSKDFSIKDRELFRLIDDIIATYEQVLKTCIGVDLKTMPVKQLCDFLSKQTSGQGQIDFVEFSRGHVEKLIKQNRLSYAKSLETTLNMLIDFFGRKNIYIREITALSLTGFSAFLKSPRKIKRVNQLGKVVEIEREAVSDRTLSDYLTDVRTLFNAAREHYNDEDMGLMVITHYPFKKLKIKGRHETKKRNLNISTIRSIRDLELPATGRTILARDVFMLSFYLVGTNLIDLYNLKLAKGKRISYNRQKTAGRRMDGAYISIGIQPEAETLIAKYKTPKGDRFVFADMYTTHQSFVKAVNTGLKDIAERLELDIPLTSYYARHSWATIARNDCRVPLEDINLALNHVDQGMSTTDIYIAKDWSLVDEANRKVLDLLCLPIADETVSED